jgi:hypothetical protein
MALDLCLKRPTSQKRALLIGISYEENEENGTLEGPHNGVWELRKMLIGEFHQSDLLG